MVQSVHRACRLLTIVASAKAPLGVRELARRSGLRAPTAQNLLKSLVSCGFLEFDEAERKYRIGLTACQIAEFANPVSCLRSFGRPYVASLHERYGVTAVLLTLWQGRVMVADWFERRHGLQVQPNGRTVESPFNLATGRALLAWNRDLWPTDPDAVRDLEEVRRKGLAITENLNDSGVYALGAPVYDLAGRVTISVGCSTPISRLAHVGREEIEHAVLRTAEAMTTAMRRGLTEPVEQHGEKT